MSVNHYENFPVASWLCPPALRPAVAALYWYARTADDLADEGRRSPQQRLSDLADYRRDLAATVAGQPMSERWPQVFAALGEAIARHHWPVRLLEDLLSAFEQDVDKHRYVDRPELLDYCRRSANPVGRLLLHLFDVDDAASLRQSDAICTALQLINFWQDLGVDTARGRLYIPLEDCARHRVPPASLLARHETPATQALVREMVQWAAGLMHEGAPLVHRVRGRFGWELRLVVQGGLRILERIRRLDYATLHTRPVLHRLDAPVLLWRAAWMQRPSAP